MSDRLRGQFVIGFVPTLGGYILLFGLTPEKEVKALGLLGK